MDFLEKLEQLMHYNGIEKISKLANLSGVKNTTLRGFYTGTYKNIQFKTIKSIKEFFDVSYDYLLNDDITDPYYGTGKDQQTILGLLIEKNKSVVEIAEELGLSEKVVTGQLLEIDLLIKKACFKDYEGLKEIRKDIDTVFYEKIKTLSEKNRLKLEGVIDLYVLEQGKEK